MKTIKLILGLTVILAFAACNKDVEENPNIVSKQNVETTAFPEEIQELLNTVTVKRPATQEEINFFKKKKNESFRGGCSLDSDAGCGEEEIPEFLRYVNNCVTYPSPSFGGFDITTTYGAISFYVDGDGDVNCDNYEDDLQNMINRIIERVGPVWDISAEVYRINTCNERSRNNYIAFRLTLLVP